MIDLDAGGMDAVAALEEAGAAGVGAATVLGFYSHVDAEVGRAAAAAGCVALPRGRFFREAAALLGGGD